MESLSECPVCKRTEFTPLLSCVDHTVSHETFQLHSCTACGFVMTNPRPDKNDLPKYYQSETYISHSNKSANAIDFLYKVARRFTLKWKLRLVRQQSLQTPQSLLDVGCGTGGFLQQCNKRGMQVTGVEPSPIARDHARPEIKSKIVDSLNNVEGQFDAITLWHVLEHISDLNETVENLKTHLNENGTIFIAVPNLNSSDAITYRESWAAYDVPRHLWHFSKQTMALLLHHHGLRLIKTLPMKLDAYYVSMLSEKYRNPRGGLSNLRGAILQAWKSNHSARLSHEYSSLIYIIRK